MYSVGGGNNSIDENGHMGDAGGIANNYSISNSFVILDTFNRKSLTEYNEYDGSTYYFSIIKNPPPGVSPPGEANFFLRADSSNTKGVNYNEIKMNSGKGHLFPFRTNILSSTYVKAGASNARAGVRFSSNHGVEIDFPSENVHVMEKSGDAEDGYNPLEVSGTISADGVLDYVGEWIRLTVDITNTGAETNNFYVELFNPQGEIISSGDITVDGYSFTQSDGNATGWRVEHESQNDYKVSFGYPTYKFKNIRVKGSIELKIFDSLDGYTGLPGGIIEIPFGVENKGGEDKVVTFELQVERGLNEFDTVDSFRRKIRGGEVSGHSLQWGTSGEDAKEYDVHIATRYDVAEVTVDLSGGEAI